MAHQSYETKLLRELVICVHQRKTPPKGLLKELANVGLLDYNKVEAVREEGLKISKEYGYV